MVKTSRAWPRKRKALFDDEAVESLNQLTDRLCRQPEAKTEPKTNLQIKK